MKIAVLSTSFSLGGAAIVTSRLVDALRMLGHEVKTFELEGKRERKPSFLKERIEIFAANGFSRKNLFKVSTASFGCWNIVGDLIAWKPDVAVFGWVNHGLLSLRQVSKIGRSGIPVVWIMHDMWNMTGICHHSMGCRRFEAKCGCCPLIAAPLRRKGDLSHRVWRSKAKTYSGLEKLTFVAVSHWLARMAAKSSLLAGRDCRVIPNVFPTLNYRPGRKEKGLIIFGAARLDDPIKGLDYAIDALNRLDPASGAHAAFFGDIRNPQVLERLRLPYELLGPLQSKEVADLCARAQVILSTSLYETLPTTLIEGQASGAIPVSFDRGGQEDIIEHLKTGWLASFGNTESVAHGIEWALAQPIEASALRESVEQKFSAEAVAGAYVELFREVTGEG